MRILVFLKIKGAKLRQFSDTTIILSIISEKLYNFTIISLLNSFVKWLNCLSCEKILLYYAKTAYHDIFIVNNSADL